MLDSKFCKVYQSACSGLSGNRFVVPSHTRNTADSGAKPKGVARRLGHANTQITQNLYTHNMQKLQEETAAIFDKNLQTKH